MSISVVRWILLIEGWLLIVGPALIARALGTLMLSGEPLPAVFDGIDKEELRLAMRSLFFASIGLAGIGVLALISSWGIKRNKIWAKWSGLLAGVLQLPGVPLFTVVGGVIAWSLWKWEPVEEVVAEEAQHPDERENPVVSGIRTVVTFALLILLCTQLYRFTESIGLPPADLGDLRLPLLFFGQFVVTILHELGHLFAALAVGFRFQVINVGPITIFKDARGRRTFHFEIRRIFSHSGFLGAIPKTEENLRSNMMIMVFAGPFVSLNVGAILFLWMLNTPGTAMAAYGEMIGYAAVIFGLDFVVNLIPLGYCDGSMLLGLAVNNQRGRQILSALTAAMHGDRADVAAGTGAIEDQIAARKKALEVARDLNNGSDASLQSGQTYLQLGIAELQAGNAAEAEQNLLKAVEILRQLKGVHPLIRAASCDGLARAYHQQQRYNESRAFGEQAFELYEASKEQVPSMDDLMEVHYNIADLQLALRQFGDAMMTAEQAIQSLPGGGKTAITTGRLRRVQAMSLLSGKSREAGVAVRRAVEALQNPSIKGDDRIVALTELCLLGHEIWKSGNEATGIQLTRSAIDRLTAEKSASQDTLVRCRMELAGMLVRSGQLEEGDALLSTMPAQLAGSLKRELLDTRGELQLRLKKMEDALASYNELLGLETSQKELALVKISLALVCESMDQAEQSANWAREACNTLMPIEDPNAAGALFALSRVMWVGGDENAEAYFEEARRILTENEDLSYASKARELEASAERFEQKELKLPAELLKQDAARFRNAVVRVDLMAPAAVGVQSGDEEEDEDPR